MISCGAGQVGSEVRPDDPTASSALGERDSDGLCRSVGSAAEPLVVDWRSNERLDLELAMKEGVAVVSYDCESLKLLKGCSVRGSYGFAGVSIKEDLVQINDRDELKANLPLSAGKLGGALERGSSLDLALVMIGKRATTLSAASPSDLVGACDGATHFVRAATVGAFAMKTGTRGKVRVVADLFGVGTEGESESTKRVSNTDGDIKACRKSTPDAPMPPEQCQSAIRLELIALKEGAAGAEPGNKPGEPHNPCPEGMVLAAGKCTTKSEAQAHLCERNDAEGCKKQCDLGDMGSCYHLGSIFAHGKDKAQRDEAKAAQLFDKACDGGIPSACYARSDMLLRERLRATDDGKKMELRSRAQQLLDKGCELGDGWVCMNTANWYLSPTPGSDWPHDASKGVFMLRRGCSLGYAFACSTLAKELLSGKQTKKDVPEAILLLQRSCDAGGYPGSLACESVGDVYRNGKDVPKDVVKAIGAYDRACVLGSMRSCNSAGVLYLKGDGVTKDSDKAREFFERGCSEERPGWDACASLGEMYEKGKGVKADKGKAAEYLFRGCMQGACTKAGRIWARGEGGAPKDETKALVAFEKGCNTTGDADACKELGALLERTNQKDKALEVYERRCKNMKDKHACAQAKRLGAGK